MMYRHAAYIANSHSGCAASAMFAATIATRRSAASRAPATGAATIANVGPMDTAEHGRDP